MLLNITNNCAIKKYLNICGGQQQQYNTNTQSNIQGVSDKISERHHMRGAAILKNNKGKNVGNV